MTRRELLISSAAALSGRFFAAGYAGQEYVDWYRKMRRCAQHNLNEYDPKILNIRSWLDYWSDLRIDALVLTGGGLLAFYPTKLPNHRKSQFLGERDLFGDYSKAARKRGIRVVARIETNWLHKDVLKARPEWFERDEQGAPRPNEESRHIYHTCVYSNYHEEQVPAIMREIASMYDVDGFFTNSWPSTGSPRPCHCANCTRRMGLSKAQALDDYSERITDLCRNLVAVAKENRVDRVYNINIAGGIRAVQSIKRLAEVGEWLTADHQGRWGANRPIWDCAQQGRVAWSAMGGKPVTNVVTGNAHAFRHTSKVHAELKLWLAQTTASGMIPWFVWLGSQTNDSRWQDTGRRFYQWIAKHEPHFANRKSVASLGVVYSQRLNHLYPAPGATPGGYGAIAGRRPPSPGNPSDFLQGMYYALLEGRFVFDFIHEDDLTPASLGRYTALVLPNIALLSDEQCRNLYSYAQSGGSLLATFETSLYNESGRPRNDFGLADVFGIRRSGDRSGVYFYAAIERPHDLLRGFTDTKWIPGGEWRVPLQPIGDPVLTIVPPYPRGIPEMVYAHERAEMPYSGPRSNEPGVVVREKGQSRLVYFPGDVDRSAWRSGNSDLSLLLQNAIRWLTRNGSPVTVAGDGMAEVFAWETEPGYAVHILNYNNPNMTRPWIRKNYPLGPQRVRVNLPAGVRISRVELLAGGTKPEFSLNGRVLEFAVPRVDDYEIAALHRA